jgi:undecaprenyl-diphosphatase
MRFTTRIGPGLKAVLSRVELSTLVGLGVLAGAMFAFIKLADEVVDGDTNHFDEAVLRLLRTQTDLSDPIGPWWIEVMFRDLTTLGGTTVLTLITIAAIGYLLVERKRAAALLILLSVIGGVIVSHSLKNAFGRPRPELVAHLVDVNTLSFPSGHAMLSAVTFLTIGVLLARVQSHLRTRVYLVSVAIVLTVLIGVSRVYLGVHFPTDVLAGWSAGAAWAMFCYSMAKRLQQRGNIENSRDP